MSNETFTADVPVERLPELQARLERLNKTATKLGTEPIAIETGERFMKEATDEDGQSYAIECVPVKVTGKAPKLNGWSFVATLEHDENGTIIRRMPTFEEEVDLTPYRNATPDNCDHCGYRRRRNDTYVVAHENATTKQVGSSCLKDFTGHQSPEQIARFVLSVRDFIEEIRGGTYDGGRITPRYYLQDVMNLSAMISRHHGYVSRRKAEETGELPTAEVVRNEFFQRRRLPTYRLQELEPIEETDVERATKTIEWVRSLDDKSLENDYLYNLYTVCKSGTLTSRQFGIAASAVVAYERAQERELQRKSQNRVDEFIGIQGERQDFTFTVFRVFTNDTEYGINHRHILRTDEGHTLVWSTHAMELEQGKRYSGNFSVKDHRESKYGKETHIFRPRKGDPQEAS